jgi:acyl-coenzyme A thioesterase PaaI-like protein
MNIPDLPFNRLIGLQRSESPGKLLRLPAGAQFLNHLGTVHASAQLALAEASSGELLLRKLGTVEGIIPVVRNLDAKFRKPANGTLESSGDVSQEELEKLLSELSSRGRAMVSVKIDLHDEAGTHTLSATAEWFIQKINPPTATEAQS